MPRRSPRRCGGATEAYHTLKKVAARAGPVHRHRRRGRLRPEPGVQRRGRDRCWSRRSSSAGYTPGRARCAIALDAASTEFFSDGAYVPGRRGPLARALPSIADYLADLCDRYPIVSIEDGMAEEDWDGWAAAHPEARRPGAARRRRPVRHQLRTPRVAASTAASPTRSWSR
ncbi:MAG: hypothetical protein V9E94_19135 [Microthrixaceae bacterium]